MAEDVPSEDDLRKAIDEMSVASILSSMTTSIASLGFYKTMQETRDLREARLAIEALRALEPVLREGGVDEALVRDLEQARANLQLAYAKAVSEADLRLPRTKTGVRLEPDPHRVVGDAAL